MPGIWEVFLSSRTFQTWRGHDQVRSLWKDYFTEADAVIFLVDSADQERFPEAREVLSLWDSPHPTLGTPFPPQRIEPF